MVKSKSGLSDRAGHGSRKPRRALDAERGVARAVKAEYAAKQQPRRARVTDFISVTRAPRVLAFDAPAVPGVSTRCPVSATVAVEFDDFVRVLKPRPRAKPQKKTRCKLDGVPVVSGTCEVRLGDKFVARLVAPGFPNLPESMFSFAARKYIAVVEDFLEIAALSHTEDTRFAYGARRAGVGLRYCKEHEALCGLGWWTHCALHPEKTEALFAMAQEIWGIFKAMCPEDAAKCEVYSAQLAQHGLHVIPGTGFSHMFLADKEARWHNDVFTGSDDLEMLDVVAVLHSGRKQHVRGGDLVLSHKGDGTRVALNMQHGSLAVINARRDMHASTRVCAGSASDKRLVASLYCEPRLLKYALKRKIKRRFGTWPPCPAEVAEYKASATYRNSAAGKAERAALGK